MIKPTDLHGAVIDRLCREKPGTQEPHLSIVITPEAWLSVLHEMSGYVGIDMCAHPPVKFMDLAVHVTRDIDVPFRVVER